jgi:hypothetical protein
MMRMRAIGSAPLMVKGISLMFRFKERRAGAVFRHLPIRAAFQKILFAGVVPRTRRSTLRMLDREPARAALGGFKAVWEFFRAN